MGTSWLSLVALYLVAVLLAFTDPAMGIGCFVCSSVNGSEPDCEDTFNNTDRFYISTCYAGRKERTGLFPATECIKLKAEMSGTGFSVLVRTCVVDNGETNTETEIGRESHCWFVNKIKYDGQYMHGCVLACDTDGCNAAPPSGLRANHAPWLPMTMAALTVGMAAHRALGLGGMVLQGVL